ncbi:MAG: hypothetical protein HN576_16955 [Bacteriovoracaceae bacterium]|jgi:hypothetical protein|nr:hypothetical protein [Bacteriovoracaceae bacterium]
MAEERVIPDSVIAAYRERVTNFKKAKIYITKNNVPKAVEYLQKYLHSVAAFWDVVEKDLNPELFKDEGHVSEQLLISYAYWDLAKSYDRADAFSEETVRCLKQFVLFSVGFKYQYANSLMIRKHIRLNKAKNQKAFQQAYEKIYVKIKSCFIATYSFNETHPVVNELRLFRDSHLQNSKIGKKFICQYYYHSPLFINHLEKIDRHLLLKRFLFRPTLYILYKIIFFYRKLVT